VLATLTLSTLRSCRRKHIGMIAPPLESRLAVQINNQQMRALASLNAYMTRVWVCSKQ
jgi:hypothetical protein